MGVTFPGESPAYRAARDRLLDEEIELRRATESVAARRRELPPGGEVPEDYVFQGAGAEGRPTDVKLSDLFEPGKHSLAIYSFMFPRDPGDKRPGPDTGGAPSGGRPLPLVRRVSRPARRRGGARRSAREHRGGRQGTAASSPRLRAGARLAPAAPALVRGQHVQPRLSRRDLGRGPETDAHGVPSTRRRDPPFLELGASTAPGIRGRIPATSAPSSRFGICSTSRRRGARPTGTSRSATARPLRAARARGGSRFRRRACRPACARSRRPAPRRGPARPMPARSCRPTP
jgi:hypothetical protein